MIPKKQSTLDKMKAILGITDIKEKVKTTVKLEEMTLENGAVLEAETFEVGSEVFIRVDDDLVPLPQGEYELSDGQMLVVEEEGIIASIGGAEAPADEDLDTEKDFVSRKEFDDLKRELNLAKAKLLLSAPKKVKETVKETVKAATTKDVEVKEPVSEPVDAKKTEMKTQLSPLAKMKIEMRKEITAQVKLEMDQPATTPTVHAPVEKDAWKMKSHRQITATKQRVANALFGINQ